MNASSLIQKVWNFCHTLKDDGVGYGDYLEQLTYLLFLKMAHEYAQEPYNRNTSIPSECNWEALRSQVGEPLEAQYLKTLHRLGTESGKLGAIFFKAQNKSLLAYFQSLLMWARKAVINNDNKMDT